MAVTDREPPVAEQMVPIALSESPLDTESPRAPSRLALLASVAVVLTALASIAITLPGAWLIVVTILIGLSVMPWYAARRRDLITSLLCITVTITAVDYLTWRIEVTNWAFWGLVATPLLVAELFGALHTLGLQYTIWPRPQPPLACQDDPTLWPIFIFIPTVDEGPHVLRPTIQGALDARCRYLEKFPHGRVTVAVCNDGLVAGHGKWAEVESLAKRMGVLCITRTEGGGAKAGNLEHARQMLGATGIALNIVFDADQVAHPDFLLKTIPPFADPRVGWVQTGQYYRNLEQPVARWANNQQALFYKMLCPGKAAHNAAFICGTNVVIRADALDQIGGLPQDSVTEDFAASIQLHPRWRSIFLTDVLATGLGPMDLAAYLKQQRRWAIGTIGVLRTSWPVIFLPRRGGLHLQQRIQYFLACTHYLSGLRDFIYIVSPLVFLITGIPAVRTATLGEFLWHFLPYWLSAQAAFWLAARGITDIRGIIIGFGSFPALIRAVLVVLLGRRSGFMVTAKQRSGGRGQWERLGMYLMILVCCLVAIWLGLTGQRARPESLAISIIWVVYDVALLASFLWLGVSDLRYKEAPTRQHREATAHVPTAWRAPRRAWLAGMVAILIAASGSLLASSGTTRADPILFTISSQRDGVPYLGLSLPSDLVRTHPAALAQEVCLPFTLIGRTQSIRDSFDFAWAEHLAAQGQRPWITLQFGVFGPGDTPPLDASLPAIVNGLQDDHIRRWAQDIHTFGRPILLTILLHVDRNWSVSSAVANGGIPQDVPRAWEHVRATFANAGDTNVAWVWAPADPAHDEPYAPPEAAIDIVLQSMIRYPSTPWPDPAEVLGAVVARHPTKPILVEVSADGEAEQKAAWLMQVAAVVRSDPWVYALLYHEGSPDIHATAAENALWAVESDDRSLQAMRTWQALVPGVALPCSASSSSEMSALGPSVRDESRQPDGLRRGASVVVGGEPSRPNKH